MLERDRILIPLCFSLLHSLVFDLDCSCKKYENQQLSFSQEEILFSNKALILDFISAKHKIKYSRFSELGPFPFAFSSTDMLSYYSFLAISMNCFLWLLIIHTDIYQTERNCILITMGNVYNLGFIDTDLFNHLVAYL